MELFTAHEARAKETAAAAAAPPAKRPRRAAAAAELPPPPPPPARVVRGPTGIRNVGNTCYLATATQVLLAVYRPFQ